MEMQATEWIIPLIQKQFKRNQRRSVSATFRHFRKYPALTHIGDYPILACILHTISTLGIGTTRARLSYVLSQSDEFQTISKKEKTELLDQLTELLHDPTKSPNSTHPGGSMRNVMGIRSYKLNKRKHVQFS